MMQMRIYDLPLKISLIRKTVARRSTVVENIIQIISEWVNPESFIVLAPAVVATIDIDGRMQH